MLIVPAMQPLQTRWRMRTAHCNCTHLCTGRWIVRISPQWFQRVDDGGAKRSQAKIEAALILCVAGPLATCRFDPCHACPISVDRCVCLLVCAAGGAALTSEAKRARELRHEKSDHSEALRRDPTPHSAAATASQQQHVSQQACTKRGQRGEHSGVHHCSLAALRADSPAMQRNAIAPRR